MAAAAVAARQLCYRLSSLSWHRVVSVANLVFIHADDDEHEDIKQRFFGLCLLDIGLDIAPTMYIHIISLIFCNYAVECSRLSHTYLYVLADTYVKLGLSSGVYDIFVSLYFVLSV